ncbi:unnamed protein product, partial [Didymodactylos carnosus]
MLIVSLLTMRNVKSSRQRVVSISESNGCYHEVYVSFEGVQSTAVRTSRLNNQLITMIVLQVFVTAALTFPWISYFIYQ